ncbi:MAG: hypothetical protein O2799_10745, partial [Planctomycetota bacterium]|nr:hypothetical protein [Planctomycetota bacterium]
REGARQALARVRAAHTLGARGAEPPLAGLIDLAPAFARGLRGFDEEQLSALRSLIEARGRIEAWGTEHGEEARTLLEVLDGAPDLSGLHGRLEATLDGRGRLRTDASPLHERLSREVQDQSSRIDQRLKEILGRADVRAVLSDASVHRRQGRPVLAVKARLSGRVRGLVHDRSASGESVFIEPSEVVQPGNRLAELRSDLRREAERIMLELARRVLDERERIEAHALLLAEVELAVVGARFMARHQAVVALQPGDEGASAGLSLRAARHPLLIQQVADGRLAEVIPIDLRVGDDFDLLLITGPNTGGKTVAMKTAGLFALLTRLGLPVPAAEGTTVPLYERVLADIGDEQEIRQNLSTFASHLVRIQEALEQADPQSLVLLDELGGGTDPEEGAALGLAVLETLLARAAHTLVSTHIGRLKEFAWRRPRAENACTAFDLESLAPLYQVHLGTPGESGALVIARRLGRGRTSTTCSRMSARRASRPSACASGPSRSATGRARRRTASPGSVSGSSAGASRWRRRPRRGWRSACAKRRGAWSARARCCPSWARRRGAPWRRCSTGCRRTSAAPPSPIAGRPSSQAWARARWCICRATASASSSTSSTASVRRSCASSGP